jgi:hypothetical protein
VRLPLNCEGDEAVFRKKERGKSHSSFGKVICRVSPVWLAFANSGKREKWAVAEDSFQEK